MSCCHDAFAILLPRLLEEPASAPSAAEEQQQQQSRPHPRPRLTSEGVDSLASLAATSSGAGRPASWCIRLLSPYDHHRTAAVQDIESYGAPPSPTEQDDTGSHASSASLPHLAAGSSPPVVAALLSLLLRNPSDGLAARLANSPVLYSLFHDLPMLPPHLHPHHQHHAHASDSATTLTAAAAVAAAARSLLACAASDLVSHRLHGHAAGLVARRLRLHPMCGTVGGALPVLERFLHACAGTGAGVAAQAEVQEQGLAAVAAAAGGQGILARVVGEVVAGQRERCAAALRVLAGDLRPAQGA